MSQTLAIKMSPKYVRGMPEVPEQWFDRVASWSLSRKSKTAARYVLYT